MLIVIQFDATKVRTFSFSAKLFSVFSSKRHEIVIEKNNLYGFHCK